MRTIGRVLAAMALPAAAAVSACAETAGPPAASAQNRQCFHASEVNGFSADNDDTVYLSVGSRRVYRAEIMAVCSDIDWSQQIALRTTGGGSWICNGLDAELLVPGPVGLDRCLITDIRRLSEAEVEAYRARR